jgi:hypothetical protein
MSRRAGSFGGSNAVAKATSVRSSWLTFKAYFVEADLLVRFSRPVNAPATNAITFASQFGVAF